MPKTQRPQQGRQSNKERETYGNNKKQQKNKEICKTKIKNQQDTNMFKD